MVIGIDPCHENLIEISSKTLKKPSKGGLPNALFILASAENLPTELNGIADHIYINFPWGSLLQGIVLGDEVLWNNIKRIGKKDATIETIFGYDAHHDSKEIQRLGLPHLDELYLNTVLIPKLKNLGFAILDLKKLTPRDLREYPTSWAKKLSFGQTRSYFHIKLQNQSDA